jgi:hypothetical protein
MGNSNMAAIYSNGGNRWNILGVNFTTGGPTMSYDWNNIVFIFKNLLESLDNRLFLLSKFCKHLKLVGVIILSLYMTFHEV